jgi:hypothetical protein
LKKLKISSKPYTATPLPFWALFSRIFHFDEAESGRKRSKRQSHLYLRHHLFILTQFLTIMTAFGFYCWSFFTIQTSMEAKAVKGHLSLSLSLSLSQLNIFKYWIKNKFLTIQFIKNFYRFFFYHFEKKKIGCY